MRAEPLLGGPGTANGIALLAAILALTGVIIGGSLNARAERRHWRYAEQVKAAADLLREYTGVHLQLARAVREGTGTSRPSADLVDWGPFNEALSVLNLMVSKEIALSAHQLDRAIWEMSLQVSRGVVQRGQWTPHRERLDACRLSFVNDVRKSIGYRSGALPALGGRPPSGDPIWQNTPPASPPQP
jgi:hypothetical protein